MNIYKIGLTSFNSWELLWETKVGLNNKEMDLLYIVFGKTKRESRKRAKELVELLSKYLDK